MDRWESNGKIEGVKMREYDIKQWEKMGKEGKIQWKKGGNFDIKQWKKWDSNGNGGKNRERVK